MCGSPSSFSSACGPPAVGPVIKDGLVDCALCGVHSAPSVNFQEKKMIFSFNILFFSNLRLCSDRSVDNRSFSGQFGSSLCGVCPSRSSVFSNIAHGAHGQARWHLETTRLGRLCSSTGTHHHSVHWLFRPHFLLLPRLP